MKTTSIYKNMKEHGTLTELPGDIPNSTFALNSTLHWMKALRIMIEEENVNFKHSKYFFKDIRRKELSEKAKNTIYEQVIFSLTQLSTLNFLCNSPNKSDVAASSIVAWYYAIYSAASAMITSQDETFSNTHAGTAKQWDALFPKINICPLPFSPRIENITTNSINQTKLDLQKMGKHSLTTEPHDKKQAWGCLTEYLSGTAKREQWKVTEEIKRSKDFKEQGFVNFKTKKSQIFRDKKFIKKNVGFLHQAFRYRGKANYRDALYLSYGPTVFLFNSGSFLG